MTTQLNGLVITTDSRLCCCCSCCAAAVAVAANAAVTTAEGDGDGDGGSALLSATVPFSYPVPIASFGCGSSNISSLTLTPSPTSFGSCPLSVVMLPHSGDDAILSIDMISPGDGTDLSIRLDGDAGPATSGDEVLVSAMLSPSLLHLESILRLFSFRS